MTSTNNLIAIYDFEVFPYALGDVLTWNVRTAMRCDEVQKKSVDIYICIDEENAACIYQAGLVNSDNFELFFSELYTAFGTHPRLGSIYIYRQREAMVERLQELGKTDKVNMEIVADYCNILNHRFKDNDTKRYIRTIENKARDNENLRKIVKKFIPLPIRKFLYSLVTPGKAMHEYFLNYIHSHKAINSYADKTGGIPYLKTALGCGADIDELFAKRLQGKKVVSFHLRLRRLDTGYGGDHSYARDSDFLEWYDFLKEASVKYPDIVFVALGRMQEKPLEILRLPNVISPRVFGMTLGHELTLMLRSDLFIGSSSGFAAFANFSPIPYFITKMNPGACHAYEIAEGAEKLPFATENQKLIYSQETSQLLMSLLQEGLNLSDQAAYSQQPNDMSIKQSAKASIHDWLKMRSHVTNTSATTCRFYMDEDSRECETAFLLLPHLEKARKAYIDNDVQEADAILRRLEKNFPGACDKIPQYTILFGLIAIENKNISAVQTCLKDIDGVVSHDFPIQLLKTCLTDMLNKVGDTGVIAGLSKLRSIIQSLNFADIRTS